MKRLGALAVAVVSALGLLVAVPPASAAGPNPTPLTNLAHLDFLTARVAPPAQARHTTYRLAQEPALTQLWVYATRDDDGSYARVGGGALHPDTGFYDQGSYDADDVARAAVVYLRHWRQFGDAHSRTQAYGLLRGLTYLQTASGPNAGNVVLWMQPDGTLNPSALPKEEPDPSDSANSYWLARTIWALGEGYRAFARHDQGFAAFLRTRMDLALHALQRETLQRYGRHLSADGVQTPAWLIVDGADASAEAVLGLDAFVAAGGDEARTPLRQLAEGIAALGTRPGSRWPYGAILPSARSRSIWHPWAGLAPAALATAAGVLRDRRLARPAIADSAGFSPRLLTTYGAINGLTPAPTDRSQIAYGVDSRVQSALAAAALTRSSGLRELAGTWAGWFFGQNAAGIPTYDPATGVTFDGVAADGTINRNSGAESTIHGLLTMLALDAAPRVRAIAQAAGESPQRTTPDLVEAEAATTTGAASTAAADPPGTAESAWSAGSYLQTSGVATARWTVPVSPEARTLEVVLDREPGGGARAVFSAEGRTIGRTATGGGAAQGDSVVPGRLVPVVVGTVPAGATTVTARFTGGAGRFDALILTAPVTDLRTGPVEVLHNDTAQPVTVTREVARTSVVSSYDVRGSTVRRARVQTGPVRLLIAPGGFTTVVPTG